MDIREVLKRMKRKYETDDTEFLCITIHNDGSGSIERESYNDSYGQIMCSWNSLQELIYILESQNEIRN